MSKHVKFSIKFHTATKMDVEVCTSSLPGLALVCINDEPYAMRKSDMRKLAQALLEVAERIVDEAD